MQAKGSHLGEIVMGERELSLVIIIYDCTSHSSNMKAMTQYATWRLFFQVDSTS